MYRTYILFFILFYSPIYLTAQEPPFQEIDYVSPIGFPMQLSGTFGELRGRHFHAGLDIKSSNGRIGDPIYAVADGYVSRLRVSAGGYGQAIYIDHANGTRSVYAHIDKFIPALESIVRDSQYAYKSFALDLTFDENQFPITRGQKIADMGNKGHSSGPHLHFEMRNAANDIPYNPHLFPIPYNFRDTEAPVIEAMEILFLNDNSEVIKRQKLSLLRNRNNYTVSTSVSIPYFQKFTLSVKTHDRQNGTHNKNGVYSIELRRDTTTIQRFSLDSIPYELTHQLDAHIDFSLYTEKKQRYHLLSQLPENKLPIYSTESPIAYFLPHRGQSDLYEVVVKDFSGNTATASFKITATEEPIAIDNRVFNYHLYHDSANLIQLQDYSLYFPAGAIYSNRNIYLTEVEDKSAGSLAPVVQLMNEDMPFNKAMTIKYPLSAELKNRSQQLFIARCEGNRIINIGSDIKGDSIIGLSRSAGTFTLMQDSTPPTIRSLQTSKAPSLGYRFVFEITDNIRTSIHSKPLRMWAELDGEWYLGEETAMNNRFYVPVPMEKTGNERELVIYAEDAMGNIQKETIRFHY